MIDYKSVMQRFHVEPKGVVHVGAYDGAEDSLYRALGFSNRLFVEAQPDTFARLQTNLRDSGAYCENYAVSDRNGKSTFHVANNGQSSSLLQMHKHLDIYPGITQSVVYEVETIELDHLLLRHPYATMTFNFLNMDIQGAELLALGGAHRLLKSLDMINLEVNFDDLYEGASHVTDLDAFLSGFDFVRADTVMAHATWGDAIYVRNKFTKALTTTRSKISKYKIDLDLSRKSIMVQPGVTFGSQTDSSIARLILSRYGRFGNNLFQILHAILIATRLEIPSIVLEDFDIVRNMSDHLDVGFTIDVAKVERNDQDMWGAFFAPFGFETLIQSFDDHAIAKFIQTCLPPLYRDVVTSAAAQNSIVLHFRGGDIFTTLIHPWYVQPPASFYLKALGHAMSNDDYDIVYLVSEDRLNPALAEVERSLEARGIPFVFCSNDLPTDISLLLSSKCIVASYGTFCEGAALLSKNLKYYYAFRTISSQVHLQPFLQSKLGSLLNYKKIKSFILDDHTYKYILPMTWENTEDQRSQMKYFPDEHLRIFEYL